MEIGFQSTLGNTGQGADLTVFHTLLKIKYDLSLLISRRNQFHGTLTVVAFQMGCRILILTAVPAVIHGYIDPVGSGRFRHLSAARRRKEHSVDPNLGAGLCMRKFKLNPCDLIVTAFGQFKVADLNRSLIPTISCRLQRHRHMLGINPISDSFSGQLHPHLRRKIFKLKICRNRSACQIRQFFIKPRIQIRLQCNTGPEFIALLFESCMQSACAFLVPINIRIVVGIITAAGSNTDVFPTEGKILRGTDRPGIQFWEIGRIHHIHAIYIQCIIIGLIPSGMSGIMNSHGQCILNGVKRPGNSQFPQRQYNLCPLAGFRIGSDYPVTVFTGPIPPYLGAAIHIIYLELKGLRHRIIGPKGHHCIFPGLVRQVGIDIGAAERKENSAPSVIIHTVKGCHQTGFGFLPLQIRRICIQHFDNIVTPARKTAGLQQIIYSICANLQGNMNKLFCCFLSPLSSNQNIQIKVFFLAKYKIDYRERMLLHGIKILIIDSSRILHPLLHAQNLPQIIRLSDIGWRYCLLQLDTER